MEGGDYVANVKITFSNGDSLEIHDGQQIIPIIRHTGANDELHASMGSVYELESHPHGGLIPSVLDLLLRCEFFMLAENPNKAYATVGIVSVEKI
jgi:hypothetical protein